MMLVAMASFAQTTEELKKQLDTLAKTQPGLEEKVQLSVSAVTLSDFISAIAQCLISRPLWSFSLTPTAFSKAILE